MKNLEKREMRSHNKVL